MQYLCLVVESASLIIILELLFLPRCFTHLHEQHNKSEKTQIILETSQGYSQCRKHWEYFQSHVYRNMLNLWLSLEFLSACFYIVFSVSFPSSYKHSVSPANMSSSSIRFTVNQRTDTLVTLSSQRMTGFLLWSLIGWTRILTVIM